MGGLKVRRAAAALIALAVAAAAAGRAQFGPLDTSGYREGGEALLHGIPWAVSFRMPLATVTAALLSHHVSAACAQALAVAAQGVLLLALCGLMCPSALLPFFGALAILLRADQLHAHFPESYYAALVLLAAGVMVWRGQKPSRAKTFLLALAFGATLLFRSPLAFFPPLLALFEFARSPRGRARERAVDAAILCVVPYLFLIPWLRLNWIAHREVIPFERAAAASNVVTGALGLVKTVEGPWESLLPSSFSPGQSPLLWAAGEAARHPVRYLSAVARRVFYVASLHPVLFGAGVLALWWRRRERAFQELALLAGYYLGLHCLMTVLPRYFDPLWPLLAAAAAAAAAGLPGLERAPRSAPSARWPRAILAAGLVAVLALCAYAERVVAAYAAPAAMSAEQARAAAVELLDRAVASSPDDAWLRLERGKRKAERGDLAGAAEDFSRGLTLRPGDPRLLLELAWTRALQGDESALARWRNPPDAPEDVRFDACVYQADAALRGGRPRAARERLLAAKAEHETTIYVNEPATPRDSAVESELRSSDSGFVWRANTLLIERPADERRRLLAAIEPLVRATARFRVEQARLSLLSGDRRAAAERLAQARRARPSAEDALRIVSLYRELKDFREGRSLLERLLESRPRDPALLLELAELEALAGGGPAALAALARAEAALPGDDGRRRRIAELYGDLKDYPRALERLKPLLERRPDDGALWLERAEVEARSGARSAALESLARAARAAPAAERRRLITLYGELGEHARALALLKPLLETTAGDSGLWLESAELEARTGDRAAALASLARAEGLKPEGEALRRRIVDLYRELGEYGSARARLSALLRGRSADAGLWLARAELEARAGSRAAALESLARAEGLKPEDDGLRSRIASLYGELREDARALALLKPLLERRPRDGALWLARAELEARAGEGAAALESLSRAEASGSLTEGERGRAWLQRAELEARAGKREAALKALARAEAAEPDDGARRRAAALYRSLKEFRRALALLEPLLERRPKDPGLWLERAELEAQTGGREAALGALARAEAAGPDDDARGRMALLYRRLEEPGRAMALLKPLLERRPKDAGLWLERAELEAKAGAKDAALASLGRAEEAGGELGRRLALDFQTLGEHGRAIAALERLIRERPGEGELYSDKGLCEYLTGDAEAAISDLETAIKLKPAFIPAYLTLGAIHTAKGRYGEALKVYDSGLARSPESGADPLRRALLDERRAIAVKVQ